MKKHKLHFVMNADLIEELESCTVFDQMGFSKAIEALLCTCMPIMKKGLEREKEENSRYRYVGNARHKAVYLEESLYRFLKQIHQDLNYYSIAQILRRVCRLFLRLVKKYGPAKALEKLEKLAQKIKKRRKGGKTIYRKRFLLQLSRKAVLQVSYDAGFQPVSYYHLE